MKQQTATEQQNPRGRRRYEILILVLCAVAIVIELLVIARYSSTRSGISLPLLPAGSSRQEPPKTAGKESDLRSKPDVFNAPVMNPIEHGFADKEQEERIKKMKIE